MDLNKLEKAAHIMESAYRNADSAHSAVKLTLEWNPDIDVSKEVLYGMWFAIDARVELNEGD